MAVQCGLRLATKLSTETWNDRLSTARAAALKKWTVILMEGGPDFDIMRQYLVSAQTGLQEILQDVEGLEQGMLQDVSGRGTWSKKCFKMSLAEALGARNASRCL